MLVCVVCVFSLFIKNTVQAETAGSGARIILYDEPKLAKFHIGRVVGSSVQRAAEATTETELTDIVFTSSDAGVCSVEEEDEYWELGSDLPERGNHRILWMFRSGRDWMSV